MKRLRIGIVLVLAAMSGACQKSGPSPQVVEVVAKGSTDEYWRTIRGGASEAAKDRGVFLEWPSDFPENDVEGQTHVLRQAVLRGKGQRYAFVFAPLYGVAFAEVIHDWEGEGLRIVTFDEEMAEEQHGGHFPTVATNNELAGREAGRYLAETIGKKGNVALIRLHSLSGSTVARERGFLREMARYEGITVVSKDHYAVGLGIEAAFGQSEEMLAELHDSKTPIQGVFTPNESTTVGMLRALENRGLAGDVAFVGFDRTPQLANAVWRGTISALVLQDPYAMGYQGVELALDTLKLSPEEFKTKAELGGFQPKSTQFRLVNPNELAKCQASARAAGKGDLTGRVLADTLLSSIRGREATCVSDGGKSCHAKLNGEEPREDEGEPGCNLNILSLLYPRVEIWHVASTGKGPS